MILVLYQEILINVVRDYQVFLFQFVVELEIFQYLKKCNELEE